MAAAMSFTSAGLIETIHMVSQMLHTQQVHITEGKPSLAILPGQLLLPHEQLLAALDEIGIVWKNTPIVKIIEAVRNKHVADIITQMATQWDLYYKRLWEYNCAAIGRSYDQTQFERYTDGFRFQDLFVDDDLKINPYWHRVRTPHRNLEHFTCLVSREVLSKSVDASAVPIRQKRKMEAYEATSSKMRSLDHTQVTQIVSQWTASVHQSVKMNIFKMTHNTHIKQALDRLYEVTRTHHEFAVNELWPEQPTPSSVVAYHTYLDRGIKVDHSNEIKTRIDAWQQHLLTAIRSVPPRVSIKTYTMELLSKELNDAKQALLESVDQSNKVMSGDPDMPRCRLSTGYPRFCELSVAKERTKLLNECNGIIPAAISEDIGATQYFKPVLEELNMEIKKYITQIGDNGSDSKSSVFPPEMVISATTAYNEIMKSAYKIDTLSTRLRKLAKWVQGIDDLFTVAEEEKKRGGGNGGSTRASGMDMFLTVIGANAKPLVQDKDKLVREYMISQLTAPILDNSIITKYTVSILGTTLPSDYERSPRLPGLRMTTLQPIMKLDQVVVSASKRMDKLFEDLTESDNVIQNQMVKLMTTSHILQWNTNTLVYNQFMAAVPSVESRIKYIKRHFPELDMYANAKRSVDVITKAASEDPTVTQFSHVFSTLYPILQLYYMSEMLKY